jgi:hypothetical protein
VTFVNSITVSVRSGNACVEVGGTRGQTKRRGMWHGTRGTLGYDKWRGAEEGRKNAPETKGGSAAG